MADKLYVDTRQLRALGRDLQRVGDSMGDEMPIAVTQTAVVIKNLARAQALAYPGGTSSGGTGRSAVADSIDVREKRPGTVEIRAGGDKVPLAGLWELGNKDSDENDPQFWHPTGWTQAERMDPSGYEYQPKWPFLRLALQEYEPRLLTKFVDLISTILHRFGL